MVQLPQPWEVPPDVLALEPPKGFRPLLLAPPRLRRLMSWGCCRTWLRVLATNGILGREEGLCAQQELMRVEMAEGQASGMGRLYPLATWSRLRC